MFTTTWADCPPNHSRSTLPAGRMRGDGSMQGARKGRPIIANIERLQRLMDTAGLDALVVRGGHNVTYLSGVAFHGTLGRHLDLSASPRGVAIVWPRRADPVFVLEVT